MRHWCCLRSAGVLGVPCLRRYLGDAHRTRRLVASLRATRLESSSVPMRIARSTPDLTRSRVSSLRSKLSYTMGWSARKRGMRGAMYCCPNMEDVVTRSVLFSLVLVCRLLAVFVLFFSLCF